MLGEAEDYLASPELFWPLSTGPRGSPLPRLTLGGLLLAMDELQASAGEMDSRQAADLSRLVSRWETLQARRPAGIAAKAASELSSRLDLWEAYLIDLSETAAATEDYGSQVTYRVMASRLPELAAGEAMLPRLLQRRAELDRRLRDRFESGGFVWDGRLKGRYPQGEYWFLYGRPRAASG